MGNFLSRNLLVAIVLGGAVLAGFAGAAQAQMRSPAFGLQFQAPIYEGDFNGDPRDFKYRAPQLPMCLTDQQIRDAIAGRGYRDIALNVPNDSLVQVRAQKDGRVYLLRFNFCSNQIEGRTNLRAAK